MSTQLARIMKSVQKPEKSSKGRRRDEERIKRLFRRVFTLEYELAQAKFFRMRRWKYLQQENLSSDFRAYCKWVPRWVRRAGVWQFYSPFHLFRTQTESTYLIADIVWRDASSREPKDHDGQILYDPEKRIFSMHEKGQRLNFKRLEEVLRHIDVKNQVERTAYRDAGAL